MEKQRCQAIVKNNTQQELLPHTNNIHEPNGTNFYIFIRVIRTIRVIRVDLSLAPSHASVCDT